MSECSHRKIYSEKDLIEKLDHPIAFKWSCDKCGIIEIETGLEFVYTYDMLMDLKQEVPYRYNED